MTRDEALSIVISIAEEWAQNTEEGLSGERINPDDTDEHLRAEYDVDWEAAARVRDIWRAISILQQP
jgi:hypothetical protein